MWEIEADQHLAGMCSLAPEPVLGEHKADCRRTPGGPAPGSFLHTLQVGRPVVTRGRQPVDEASPPCDLVRCHGIT